MSNDLADSPAPPTEEYVVLLPAERRDTLLHLIRGARRRLILTLFRCDDTKITDEIAEALDRGVKVEVLLTQKAKGWERRLKGLRVFLESLGASVYRYEGGRAKYHAKYLVADESLAMVASLNFTHKCFTETADFLLVTPDPGVVDGLQRLFEADRKAAPIPRNLAGRLIVGPEHARERITKLIEEARQSIRIVDHRVVDPAMVDLLRRRRDEGITVQVFGRGEIRDRRSHGKMMLVDNQRAVLGSISLSPPSLDSRREVAVLVDDPSSVDRLRAFLDEQPATEWVPPAAPALAEEDDEDDEEDEGSDS